jgi:hypothetical protein
MAKCHHPNLRERRNRIKREKSMGGIRTIERSGKDPHPRKIKKVLNVWLLG